MDRLPCAIPLEGRAYAQCEATVAKLATTSWLFVTFGEHQVIAQLIAKRVLISPLINKDFPVRHSLLARGNFASVNLNHQK
jgi:hypothetical protein